MIKVDILRNSDGQVVEFEMEGHANVGDRSFLSWLFRTFRVTKYGNIVCAAVSAITQTTVNSLSEIAGLELQLEVDDNDGYLHCSLPENPDVEKRKIADILIDNMLMGITSIQEEYPMYINVTEYENEEV